MICLTCDGSTLISSEEHIIPESLGNSLYVLKKGIVCRDCNNRFSKFEDKAIYNSYLSFIRIQNGVKTKKKKPSAVKIGSFEAHGIDEYTKDVMFMKKYEDNITKFHEDSDKIDLLIENFDKSEMATAKMLLKIGFESLFKSQKRILNKYSFSELKDYLNNVSNKDWPFITSHKVLYPFKSIPTFGDKNNLNRIKCYLRFYEKDETTLLFDFQYDYFNLSINLLHRTFDWSSIYFENDTSTSLYPRHLKRPLYLS